MATQPKKELTEAEQYAAEEKARSAELAKQQEAEAEKAAADAAAGKADTGDKDKTPAKAPAKTAQSRNRPASKAKPKERVEVYEQRGPKGLYKVTRNIDTGKTEAELIDE